MRLYSGYSPFKFLVFLPLVAFTLYVTILASMFGILLYLIGIPGLMGAAGLIRAWAGLLSDVPERKRTTIALLCAGLLVAPVGLIMAISLSQGAGSVGSPRKIHYAFILGEGIIFYSILAKKIFFIGLNKEINITKINNKIKNKYSLKLLSLPVLWVLSRVIIIAPYVLYSNHVEEKRYNELIRIKERTTEKNKFVIAICSGKLEQAKKAVDDPSVVQDEAVLQRSLICLNEKQGYGIQGEYSVHYHPERVPLLLDAILIHEKFNGTYSFAGCTRLQTELLRILHAQNDIAGINYFKEKNFPFNYCFKDINF